MELHAIGLLSALGAAVFSSLCAADGRALGLLFASFAVGIAVVATTWLPAPATLAAAILAIVALGLARPRWSFVPPVAAGSFAAGWVSVLVLQGLPWAPASVAAAGLVATGAVLARRPGFAPPVVRDEALLLVGALGLLLAVGAGVVAGWRSAVVLTAQPLAGGGSAGSVWLLAVVLGCVLLGGLYSAWKRR